MTEVTLLSCGRLCATFSWCSVWLHESSLQECVLVRHGPSAGMGLATQVVLQGFQSWVGESPRAVMRCNLMQRGVMNIYQAPTPNVGPKCTRRNDNYGWQASTELREQLYPNYIQRLSLITFNTDTHTCTHARTFARTHACTHTRTHARRVHNSVFRGERVGLEGRMNK